MYYKYILPNCGLSFIFLTVSFKSKSPRISEVQFIFFKSFTVYAFAILRPLAFSRSQRFFLKNLQVTLMHRQSLSGT